MGHLYCRCTQEAAGEAESLIAMQLSRGSVDAVDRVGDSVDVNKGPIAVLGELQLKKYGPKERQRRKETARARVLWIWCNPAAF